MAKKPAPAKKARAKAAVPDAPPVAPEPKKKKPAPNGIPQELWDSWALPEFPRGPNGEVTPEEQAAVDEQGAKIREFRKSQRAEAEAAEKANREDKERRAAERRQKIEDRWTAIERRLTALEEKANG